MMKRYWLFAGDTYEPYGGMKDFKGHFDTPEAAKEAFWGLTSDWGQLVDSHNGQLMQTIEINGPIKVWKNPDYDPSLIVT